MAVNFSHVASSVLNAESEVVEKNEKRKQSRKPNLSLKDVPFRNSQRVSSSTIRKRKFPSNSDGSFSPEEKRILYESSQIDDGKIVIRRVPSAGKEKREEETTCQERNSSKEVKKKPVADEIKIVTQSPKEKRKKEAALQEKNISEKREKLLKTEEIKSGRQNSKEKSKVETTCQGKKSSKETKSEEKRKKSDQVKSARQHFGGKIRKEIIRHEEKNSEEKNEKLMTTDEIIVVGQNSKSHKNPAKKEHTTTATAGDQVLSTSDQILSTGDQVLSTGDQILSTGDQILSTGDQVLSTGDQVLSTGDQILSTGDQILSTGDQILSTGDQILSTGDQVLSTGDQILSTGDQVLSTGDQVLSTGDQVLSTGDQVLSTGDQVLSTGYQVLSTGDQVLSTGYQVLSIGDQVFLSKDTTYEELNLEQLKPDEFNYNSNFYHEQLNTNELNCSSHFDCNDQPLQGIDELELEQAIRSISEEPSSEEIAQNIDFYEFLFSTKPEEVINSGNFEEIESNHHGHEETTIENTAITCEDICPTFDVETSELVLGSGSEKCEPVSKEKSPEISKELPQTREEKRDEESIDDQILPSENANTEQIHKKELSQKSSRSLPSQHKKKEQTRKTHEEGIDEQVSEKLSEQTYCEYQGSGNEIRKQSIKKSLSEKKSSKIQLDKDLCIKEKSSKSLLSKSKKKLSHGAFPKVIEKKLSKQNARKTFNKIVGGCSKKPFVKEVSSVKKKMKRTSIQEMLNKANFNFTNFKKNTNRKLLDGLMAPSQLDLPLSELFNHRSKTENKLCVNKNSLNVDGSNENKDKESTENPFLKSVYLKHCEEDDNENSYMFLCSKLMESSSQDEESDVPTSQGNFIGDKKINSSCKDEDSDDSISSGEFYGGEEEWETSSSEAEVELREHVNRLKIILGHRTKKYFTVLACYLFGYLSREELEAEMLKFLTKAEVMAHTNLFRTFLIKYSKFIEPRPNKTKGRFHEPITPWYEEDFWDWQAEAPPENDQTAKKGPQVYSDISDAEEDMTTNPAAEPAQAESDHVQPNQMPDDFNTNYNPNLGNRFWERSENISYPLGNNWQDSASTSYSYVSRCHQEFSILNNETPVNVVNSFQNELNEAYCQFNASHLFAANQVQFQTNADVGSSNMSSIFNLESVPSNPDGNSNVQIMQPFEMIYAEQFVKADGQEMSASNSLHFQQVQVSALPDNQTAITFISQETNYVIRSCPVDIGNVERDVDAMMTEENASSFQSSVPMSFDNEFSFVSNPSENLSANSCAISESEFSFNYNAQSSKLSDETFNHEYFFPFNQFQPPHVPDDCSTAFNHLSEIHAELPSCEHVDYTFDESNRQDSPNSELDSPGRDVSDHEVPKVVTVINSCDPYEGELPNNVEETSNFTDCCLSNQFNTVSCSFNELKDSDFSQTKVQKKDDTANLCIENPDMQNSETESNSAGDNDSLEDSDINAIPFYVALGVPSASEICLEVLEDDYHKKGIDEMVLEGINQATELYIHELLRDMVLEKRDELWEKQRSQTFSETEPARHSSIDALTDDLFDVLQENPDLVPMDTLRDLVVDFMFEKVNNLLVGL